MSSTELTKALYSVKEVCKMLNVSDDTVRRMIKSGELEGLKVSFQWRVKRDSLRKYL
jgi:excisionase family DNA binding protein